MTQVITRKAAPIAERIQMEVAKNKAFADVCKVWAARERTREEVTLANLRVVMHREGYHHKRERYVDVLKFLASIGVGQLYKSANGQVRSLKNIRTKLQSIGLAGLGQATELEKFTPPKRFKNIAVPLVSTDATPKAEAPKKEVVQPTKQVSSNGVGSAPERYPIFLTAVIGDSRVSFQTSMNLTLTELEKLVFDMGNARTENKNI